MMLPKILAAAAALVCATASIGSPPRMHLVRVEKNVSVEVLDWGGSGSPLVFLAGFGQTAHDLQPFAVRFTDKHHVYGITRRGFGKSSRPPATTDNFDPQRLGADILAVMHALRIDKPVLVGHSIAGEELSEIGTRHPSEIAGLIYLDAAESQAFYGPNSPDYYPIAAQVRRDLQRLTAVQPSEMRILVKKLQAELPRLQASLAWYNDALEGEPDRPAEMQTSPQMAIETAVANSQRIYGRIDVPILSIVASPPACEPDCGSPRSERDAADVRVQATDFAVANPQARVVRLPYAGHFLFQTNEKEVEREMNLFLNRLR